MEKNRRFLKDSADLEQIFYLTCCDGPSATEKAVWFVNNSNEILDYVRPSSGGFTASDDEVISMTQSPNSVEYRDVKPCEAVLIDNYDVIFDGDFVISWGVEMKSASLGKRHLTSDLLKGREPNVCLHWQSLEEEIRDSE